MPGARKSGLTRNQRKSVQKMINGSIETKHTVIATGAWDYIGGGLPGVYRELIELSNLSQGTGDHARIGDQVTAQKVYGKHLLRVNGGNTSVKTTVRAMVVQSRGGALTANDFPDYYQNADLDKMIVLQDRLYSLSFGGTDYATGVGNNLWQVVHNFNIKAKRMAQTKLQYDDASTTPRNAPLYLYFVSETAGNVEYAGYCNMYYKDA